jgi:hypothetical protein
LLEWRTAKKSFKAQTKSELYIVINSDCYNFKPYLYVFLKDVNRFKLIHNVYVFCLFMQACESKNMVRKQTGIVYDRRMTEHKCIWDPNYPECPERFTRVLERYGMVEVLCIGLLLASEVMMALRLSVADSVLPFNARIKSLHSVLPDEIFYSGFCFLNRAFC